MTIKEIHERFLSCSEVSIDTRSLKKDALFIAIKGTHFDGNKYAAQALEKGAKFAIIDNPKYQNQHTILVQDCLTTLQELAHYHRMVLKTPIVALTGSNGKTTTKELINAVLSTTFNCYATKGNFNNHIGVPLTLLSFTKETEIGIVEMGANHHKEIAALCKIAAPDYGYITNFGKAHLEGFGSVEGVIKAKSEMYDYLRAHQKMAFINYDDEKQIKQAEGIKDFGFSASKNTPVSIQFKQANPFVTVAYKNLTIESRLIGEYNFSNISAAIAIGTYFKIPAEKIAKAIEQYTPDNNRSEVIKTNKNTIILDAYNANPTSMIAALKSFSKFSSSHQNSAVILGDMFELGENALQEHQDIITFLEKHNFKTIIVIGTLFKSTSHQPHIKSFETLSEARETISQIQDANVLIKGSRGMKLEGLLDTL